MTKPEKLFHGSEQWIEGLLKPVIEKKTPDHTHEHPAVFATERLDIAALFMFPMNTLHSVGFEQDIAYICIWGTSEEFSVRDKGGYIYVLSSDLFEKMGKEYEWQSFKALEPAEVKTFPSAITGMVECGVQVYFINDDSLFDRVFKEKDYRAPILRELISENKKLNKNIKYFM